MEALAHPGMLSGWALMGQASRSDRQVFELSPSVDDGPVPVEVDVGGGEVAEAFVVAAVVVAFDEGANAGFEIARQAVVLEQDAVLQGLVPTLDLALGLRMVRCAADVSHPLVDEPIREVAGDVGRAVIAEQPWLVDDLDPVAARCLQGQLEGLRHIVRPHGRAQLPGDDVAGVVVEDGRQIEPAPADDLEVGESVCHSWFGAVVGSWKASAALMTTKAGLVIRSWAFRRR
jgi:hypothetical protein